MIKCQGLMLSIIFLVNDNIKLKHKINLEKNQFSISAKCPEKE